MADGNGREGLPYDDSDEKSILEYAGNLTSHTLDEFVQGEAIIGDAATKGKFGQIVEEEYFGIPTNNRHGPDFEKVGIELKVAPMVRTKRKGELVSKERMVLTIIDYNEVPEKGFDIFLNKGSHILIVFFLNEGDDIRKYRILKVVDWKPDEDELRVIHEDWDVIEGYVMRGEAELLSERHTRFLAANPKGAGHGRDMRSQPFSDVKAQQRSLSFKTSFMTSLYHSHPDVGESFVETDPDEGSVFEGGWSEGTTFAEHVRSRFDRFVGMTCLEIEAEVGEVSHTAKDYNHLLAMAMLGLRGKKRVKEFEEAGISMKTIPLKRNGTPKESMSFPAFKYAEVAAQDWEGSDFRAQLDHQFLFLVFQYHKDPKKERRWELTFRGAFLWYVPDSDMGVVRGVWEDTRAKIVEERFDEFIGAKDRRIAHVRPHGRNSADTQEYKGHRLIKRCFWLNADYIKGVVEENLDIEESGSNTRKRRQS